MTQDERWLARYNELKTFIETNKRNPSKFRMEEHDFPANVNFRITA